MKSVKDITYSLNDIEQKGYYGNYDMHGIVCKKCNAKVYGYAKELICDET